MVVGIDTSGSIGGEDLNRFLSEVRSIAEDVRPEQLELIYWDAQVAGHETYGEQGESLDTLVASTKPKGGGGTDPRCVEKYLTKEAIEPECIIMLTDGEVPSWGENWTAPILWVVCNPCRTGITASVGKTVHINS